MALPWVKLHHSLLDNDVFRMRISAPARLTFMVSLALAGKCNQEGRLALRGISQGLSADEIAFYTGLAKAAQQRALDDLVAVGLLGRDSALVWYVQRFEEFQGESPAAGRMRSWRGKKRNGSVTPVTPALRNESERSVTLEEEEDIRKTSVLREKSGKWVPPPVPDGMNGRLPDGTEDLVATAVPFLAAFANATTEESVAKNGPGYASALAIFRSRGCTIPEAWECFCAARTAQGGRPLFASQAKTAISYLQARPRAAPSVAVRPGERDPSIVAAEIGEAMRKRQEARESAI